MKAFQWIIFGLVALAIGVGAAFALHPPKSTISDATASTLTGDLQAISRYTAAGRCSAMQARINSAQTTISRVKSQKARNSLQQKLVQVESTALDRCQSVVDGKAAALASTPTTPDTTPASTPVPTPGGNDGGGPDTGSGEGTATSPNTGGVAPAPSGGTADPNDTGSAGSGTDTGGGGDTEGNPDTGGGVAGTTP